MALPTGLAAQLGWTKETTAGVLATPATFIPMLEGESITRQIGRTESGGIIAGRQVKTARQWSPGGWEVGGSTPLELMDRGIDSLFELIFGGVSTDTYTPGPLPSATIQYGVPGGDGTVRPKTMLGAKVESAEIGFAPNEIVTLGIDWVGQKLYGVRTVSDGATNTNTTVTSATAVFSARDLGSPISGTGIPAATTIVAVASATSVTISAAATATATGVTLTIGVPLASATFSTTQRPFHCDDISLTVGGAAVAVMEGRLSIENNISGTPMVGQRWIDEPQSTDHRLYQVELSPKFTNTTQLDRYERGDEFALVLTFSAAPAAGTGASVVITMNGHYDADAQATVEDKGEVPQSLTFTCNATAAGADSTAISAVVTEGV